jgi:hypothetical protein
MSFVIYVNGQRDYYSGKTYTHQGETFPCVCKRDEAKRYKSKKIADNVAERLAGKCDDDFCVEEFRD